MLVDFKEDFEWYRRFTECLVLDELEGPVRVEAVAIALELFRVGLFELHEPLHAVL